MVHRAFADIKAVTHAVLQKANGGGGTNGKEAARKATELVKSGEAALRWFFVKSNPVKTRKITIELCAETLEIDLKVLQAHALKLARENGWDLSEWEE